MKSWSGPLPCSLKRVTHSIDTIVDWFTYITVTHFTYKIINIYESESLSYLQVREIVGNSDLYPVTKKVIQMCNSLSHILCFVCFFYFENKIHRKKERNKRTAKWKILSQIFSIALPLTNIFPFWLSSRRLFLLLRRFTGALSSTGTSAPSPDIFSFFWKSNFFENCPRCLNFYTLSNESACPRTIRSEHSSKTDIHCL